MPTERERGPLSNEQARGLVVLSVLLAVVTAGGAGGGGGGGCLATHAPRAGHAPSHTLALQAARARALQPLAPPRRPGRAGQLPLRGGQVAGHTTASTCSPARTPARPNWIQESPGYSSSRNLAIQPTQNRAAENRRCPRDPIERGEQGFAAARSPETWHRNRAPNAGFPMYAGRANCRSSERRWIRHYAALIM